MQIWLCLVAVLCQFKHSDSLVVKGNEKVEERGAIDVICYLGINDHNRAARSHCNKEISVRGLMYFEAVRFTVSHINSNSSVLQNVKLGYSAVNTCKGWMRLRRNIKEAIANFNNIGVLGPPTSEEAIFSVPVLGVFNLPVISHLATSIELEDRQKYANFYRTVPSDRFLIKAYIDMLLAFNWNYVSVVGSYGNYGHGNVENFISSCIAEDICIFRHMAVGRYPNQQSYYKIISELLKDARSRVVLLFTSREDTVKLFHTAMAMRVPRGRFIWVGSTQVATAITPDVAQVTEGAMTLQFDLGENDQFKNYFLSLNPVKANYSWFHLFWEQVFNCNLNKKNNSRKNCTGKEKLVPGMGYDETVSVNGIVSAVKTYACGVKQMVQEHCGSGDAKLCQAMWIFNENVSIPAEDMTRRLKKRTMECQGVLSGPMFLNDGGIRATYSLFTTHYSNNNMQFVQIGSWDLERNNTDRFQLFHNSSQFLNVSWLNQTSSCALPCNFNEIKKMEDDHQPCCWSCEKCGKDSYAKNGTCVQCPPLQTPKSDQNGCLTLPVHHVSTSDPVSIATLVFCFLGIKLTTVVLGVYLKYWDSRIVKAAGKELSSVMIVGLYMCFLAPIFFLSKPDQMICSIQRFVVGVSLTTCYIPLLLKTNRIYRIFQGAKSAILRPSFISPRSQVLICVALISIQVLFGITWVVANPPEIVYLTQNNSEFVTMLCAQSEQTMLLNLGICCVMMLICTYFAFKTRKFPKNYNESRSIVLTMYLTCFAWGIFIPIFFYSERVDLSRVYIISVFCIVIAYVTLIGLFESRVRLLLFPSMPKDEDRSTSTGQSPGGDMALRITHITRQADLQEELDCDSVKKVHFDDICTATLNKTSDNLDKSLDTEVEDN